MKSIFVNIASYRDNLLSATINSLIKNESGRNKITYGIFEQIKYEDSLEKKNAELLKQNNIRYKRIDPQFSDGVVWARSINSMQHDEEEFYYQIDSHMLFDKDWDNFLIFDYNQAKKYANTDKVIVSSGCKNFEVYENRIIKHTMSKDITVKFGYYQFGKNLQLKVHGAWIPATESVTPSIHAIAGNFFTTSRWLKDVGYNAKLYFDAEEQYMAISSIIAGYKIFHQRNIKCYHYLDSAKHLSKQEIDPVIDPKIIEKNKLKEEKEFINYIYSLEEEQLNNYYQETGVDYINRKLEERAITRSISSSQEVDWEIKPIVNTSEENNKENGGKET